MNIPLQSLYYDLQRAARHAARQPTDHGSLSFVVQTVTLGAILFAGNMLARKLLRNMVLPSARGRS